ncbi:hypothetical protein [Pseudonocardia nigra]|uniref:hypothetical protein n=1 Tax=Pseudonocardia nigra TaxID=1921578 RepID=UPI001C5E72D0|nr:hypothetical protein [Pseudonocardia nigra]
MNRDDPPPGLQDAGRALWRDLLDAFQLAEHERRILLECCRTADSLDQLAEVVASEGVMEPGTGRVHPALVEQRQQRAILAKLVASLRVPDDSDERPQRRGAARPPQVVAMRRRPADADTAPIPVVTALRAAVQERMRSLGGAPPKPVVPAVVVERARQQRPDLFRPAAPR